MRVEQEQKNNLAAQHKKVWELLSNFGTSVLLVRKRSLICLLNVQLSTLHSPVNETPKRLAERRWRRLQHVCVCARDAAGI